MTDARTPDDVATEHERVAEWDAAYVLGALDAEDRRAYERHVAVCDRCRAAVADLAGMPALLALVPAGEVPGFVAPGADEADVAGAQGVAAPANVVDLGAVAARLRRGQVRRRWTAAAVAAGLLVVGGGAGWAVSSAVGPDGGSSVSASATTVNLAPVGGSGVTAELSLDPVAWGTRVSWSCRYPADAGPASTITGPYAASTATSYSLVLVDRDGSESTVGTWAPSGTGASGLHASTSIAKQDVASVEIRLGDVAVARGTV